MQKDIKVNYLTPYAVDKNIGREYNRCISLIPDDEWVCIRDGDTIFMAPDSAWGKQIHDIVQVHGNTFGLIGAKTNRIGSKTKQRYSAVSMDEADYNVHKRIGAELYRLYYTDVRPTNNPIAGMFMLFSKDTWKKFPFKETAPYHSFDTDFSRRVHRAGLKLGIARGVYLFHDYRWDTLQPEESVSHLIK